MAAINIFDAMLDVAMNRCRTARLKNDVTFSTVCSGEITYKAGTISEFICDLGDGNFNFECGDFAVVVDESEIEFI